MTITFLIPEPEATGSPQRVFRSTWQNPAPLPKAVAQGAAS
jgi:hypothetical protein